MGQEIAIQNALDFAAGKIKCLEDMPLYREETPDGIVLHNIPDEMIQSRNQGYHSLPHLFCEHLGAEVHPFLISTSSRSVS